MDKIGIAFRSKLGSDEVREIYITPLRAALKKERTGIYTNHLHQVDPDTNDATEHLLVFEVKDFKTGLRVLRVELERIGPPGDVQFQNLNPSTPGY